MAAIASSRTGWLNGTTSGWSARSLWDSGTNMYAVVLDTATTKIRIHKGTGDGTWTEQNSAGAITHSGATHSYSSWSNGSFIYVVYRTAINTIRVRRFNISTNTWEGTDHGGAITASVAEAFSVRVVVRSDGDVLVFYRDVTSSDIFYTRYEGTSFTTGSLFSVAGTQTVLDAIITTTDMTHVFYYDTAANDLFTRSIDSSNTLGTSTAIDATSSIQFGGCAGYVLDGATHRIAWLNRDSTGEGDLQHATSAAAPSFSTVNNVTASSTTDPGIMGANVVAYNNQWHLIWSGDARQEIHYDVSDDFSTPNFGTDTTPKTALGATDPSLCSCAMSTGIATLYTVHTATPTVDLFWPVGQPPPKQRALAATVAVSTTGNTRTLTDTAAISTSGNARSVSTTAPIIAIGEPWPINAAITASVQSSTSLSIPFSCPTTAANLNRFLLVIIANRAPFSHARATSVSWDSGLQDLTYIGRQVGAGSDHSVEFWGYVNPLVGTDANINITFPDTRSAVASAQVFMNVDPQTLTSAINGSGSTTGSPSVDINTRPNDLIVDGLQRVINETVTAGSGQAERYKVWSGTEVFGASSFKKAISGSTTMSWSTPTATYWTLGTIALQHLGRIVGTTIAISTGGSTFSRVVASTAAISTSANKRIVGATAAISTTANTRVVGATVAVSVSGGGSGNITRRTAVETVNSTAAASYDINKPTGMQDGDYVVLSIVTSGNTPNQTPSGFSLIKSEATQTNPRLHIYGKFVSSVAGEGTWTFGTTTGVNGSTIAQAYGGVDTTTPIDVTPNSASGSTGSNAMTVTGVTTVTNNALLLYHHTPNSASSTLTPPAEMTEDLESSGGRKNAIDYEVRATAGATGDRTGSAASSTLAWAAALYALRPASSGATSFQRVVASTAAIQTTNTRAVAATAAVDALGGIRVVGATISLADPISGNGVGHWRWYTDNAVDTSMVALAGEDATPTLTGAQTMGGIIRLRVQLRNTGNITALNPYYSVDGTNYNDVASVSPNSTTVNRWIRFVNGAATANNTITTQLLSGSTASGKYHETTAVSETVGSGAIVEVDLAFKIIWPPPNTTVKIQLRDGSTAIPLATGATDIQFTTCTPSQRDFTIDRAEPNTSAGQNREMNHGMWQRLHYDGTDWWFFTIQPNDGTNLTYYRWPNGSGNTWNKSTVGMTVNAATTSEADVKHSVGFRNISGTHVVGVLFAPSSGNMHYRRGRFTGGAITWNADTDLGQARYAAHSHTVIDDGGYHWIGGINGSSGVWACRSTAADDGTSGYAPSFGTISTRRKTASDTTAAGNIFALVPLASDKVMALWNTGSTLKAAVCTDAGGFGSVVTVNSTASAHPADWGITRIGNTVYLIHSDNTSTGGTWRARQYSISGDSWSAWTDPGAAQPTQNSNADGLVLTNDGTNIYAFGTTIGTEGGQDRTITAIKWDGASWTNLGIITPAGGRGNGDDIAGPDVAGGGKVPIAYLMNDNDVNGFPFTYEVHALTIASTVSRTVAATAAISTSGNTRTVASTVAVSVTALKRTVAATVAVSVTGLSRSVASTAAISVTGLTRSVGSTAAISVSALKRTIAAQVVVSTTANTRIVAATVAISTIGLGRTVTSTIAVSTSANVRSIGSTISVVLPSGVRIVAPTIAVSTTANTRSVGTSLAASVAGNTRSLGATITVTSGAVRSIGTSVAILTTLTRSVASTVSVSTSANKRIVAATAAISLTFTRSVPATAAVQTTVGRPVAATISVQTFANKRTVGATASITTLGLTRSLAPTVAIQVKNTRIVTSTVAITQTNTRSVASTVSLNFTFTRSVATTAAIQTSLSRSVASTAAITQTNVRVVAATIGISGALGRSVPTTVAITQSNTRVLTDQIVVSTIANKRIVTSTAAISLSFNRTVASTVSVQVTGLKRVVASTAAIQVNATRAVGTTIATRVTLARVVGSTVSVRTTNTRSVATTIAVRTTNTRTVVDTIAIRTTLTRQLATTAAIRDTRTRSLTSTIVINIPVKRIVAATISVSSPASAIIGGLIRVAGSDTIFTSRVASNDDVMVADKVASNDVVLVAQQTADHDVFSASKDQLPEPVALMRNSTADSIIMERTEGNATIGSVTRIPNDL